jgi:hypothetical protein
MPVYLKCGKCDRFNHERHEKSRIKREISPHPPHESSGRDFHRLNAEIKGKKLNAPRLSCLRQTRRGEPASLPAGLLGWVC